MHVIHFKSASRSLLRYKSYTLVNIAGLSIGIGVFFLVALVIRFESGFDNFHANKERIYRILTEYHHADSKDVFYGAGVPFAVPRGIATSFKQLEQVAPVFTTSDDQVIISSGDHLIKKFKEPRGAFYTTPAFFKIFNFPMLAGSYQSLSEPNSVLLSKETAEKYYGDWHTAIGKTFRLNNTVVLKVTGVLATIPANTDFQVKMMIAYGTGSTKAFLTSTDYDATNGESGCYVLAAPLVSPVLLNRQVIEWSKSVKAAGNKDVQTIQPLEEVHFATGIGNFSHHSISHQLINFLWLIGIFILLIACVNFINLTTAQSANRSREVGVKKVLGSRNWQIKIQFLTETFLVVLFSIAAAFAFAWLMLPYIGRVLDLPLQINLSALFYLLQFAGLLTILVTLLAGFYPSLVLSRFNPVNALKSKQLAKSDKGFSLRRVLVVFQFVIAQSLIIGTVIIVRQMNSFYAHPLGFQKNSIINIPIPADSAGNSRINFLKGLVKNIRGVQSVTMSSNTPVEDNNDNWTMFNFNQSVKQTDFYSIIKAADNDYLPTYKLSLVAGRNLQTSDTMKEFLVNEMLVKNLGIADPQDILGKEISFSPALKGPVVGVLKDFYTRSFHDGMAPLIITSFKKNYTEAAVRVSTDDLTQVIAALDKTWNETFPDFVFEYNFLDKKVEGFYKHESQLAQLYKIFALIAIFLSCLGLYGLASFMAVQRIKEVGIRKVLGATGANIVYLFSREFVLLIAIAFLLAVPLSGYFMNQWLQGYSLKTGMSWWIFALGGLFSVFIALTTVSFQALKAAWANPVKSLKME